MKNAFYFTLKAVFVVEIFTFLSGLSGYIEKRLNKKENFHFKIYDITDWTTNNYKIHIAQYPKKQSQSGNEVWSVDKI